MTQPDCLKLQRKARRSGRLRANACLLLAEICDLHGCEKGCIIGNKALADHLGCTERSIRKWLRELTSEGLVTEGTEAAKRVLVPRVPSWMEWNEDSCEEATFQQNTERSGTEVPERNERSEKGGTNVPTQRDNKSESVRERAPAHEEDPVRSTEDLFGGLVEAWRSVRSAPPLGERREKVLYDWSHDREVEDPDLFREVLAEQAADTSSKGVGMSMGILLKEYKKQRDAGKLEPWQQKDDRYSINEAGEVCFKGTPLDEIGPQNVYET